MPLCTHRTYNQRAPENDNLKVKCFVSPCAIYHDEEGEEENREALIELSPGRFAGGPAYYDPDDDWQLNDEERITYSLQNILLLAFEEQDNPNTVKVMSIMI